jgi:hypothetical protein
MEKTDLKEKTGDFLLDIAKLLVAGVVLSSIFDDSMTQSSALIWGIVATIAFTIGGYFFLYKTLKK